MRTTSNPLPISVHIQSLTCSLYWNENCFRQKQKGRINKSVPSSPGVFLAQNVLKLLTLITILCISMDQHKHKNSFDLSSGGAGEVRKKFMTSQQQVSVNNTLASCADMSCEHELLLLLFHSVLLYLVGAVPIFESNIVTFWRPNIWWPAKSDRLMFVTGHICFLHMVTLAVTDPNHVVKIKAVLTSWGQQQLHQIYRKKDEKF